MKKIIALGFVLGVTPLMASAAGTIEDIILILLRYLGYVLPALITIAVIYFVWGIIQFMTSDDEESKKLARTKIINGLIGLFIIISFWGIIAIVQKTFNVGNATGTLIVPCTPTYIAGVQQPC